MSRYFLILFALLFSITNVCAEEVRLSWDASPSPEVSGYKIYFKANSPDLPFNGGDAQGTSSPLDVGDALTTTIRIPDNSTYFFTCTAYDSAGYESSYSNIVSNREFIEIELLSPLDSANSVSRPVTFQWSPAAPGLEYTLYYGTDPDLAGLPASNRPGSTLPPQNIWFMSPLLAFLSLKLKGRINFGPWRLALGLLLLGLTLNACGGGGSESADQVAKTRKIVLGSTQNYRANDLKPATAYFWKVMAIDNANPSVIYTSKTGRFTTASQ